MALQTLLQYTESNLVGTLTEGLTTSASTIRCRFYDTVTGEPREPLSTTKLFVIDKGSASQPSSSYEIILAGAHTTTDGVTTMTSCTRGLAFSGVSLAAGTGKIHTGSAEIGTVDLHFLTSIIVATLKGVGDQPILKVYATDADRTTDVSSPSAGMYCYVTATTMLWFYDGTRWCMGATAPSYANATARDAAITNPRVGMQIYNVADGTVEYYIAGSWTPMGTSTTPNASTTVAGKVQQATDAQVGAQTVTGSSGAPLFINPGSTSDTAADNKIPVGTSSDGLDYSWLPNIPFMTLTAGETLVAGEWVYIEQSDNKAYKADATSLEKSAVVGAVIANASTNTNVYIQTGGVVSNQTGLTTGADVYLSSVAGRSTSTIPATDSATVWPVRLGHALSTTSLSLQIQRIQRVRVLSSTVGASASYTFNLGFVAGFVTGQAMDYRFNSTAPFLMQGTYNSTSNTTITVTGSGIVNTGFLEFLGPSNAGVNRTAYTASVSGTDLVLTRTSSTISISEPVSIIAYENL